jgi:hypothetical protein
MRGFYALVALLLAGTIAAYLRLVPLWSVLTVSLILVGMALTFMLGAFAGSGRILPWHRQRLSDQPAEALVDSARTVAVAGQDTHKPPRQPVILTYHR